MSTPKLTASYVTLAGAGFAEPPRFTFRQRCEAASAAGFARIGIHLNDLKTLKTADVADILSDNNLELGEIEFFAGWAAPGAESATRATLEKVRELAVTTGGGDHLSSGDFVGGPLDIDGAATRLNERRGGSCRCWIEHRSRGVRMVCDQLGADSERSAGARQTRVTPDICSMSGTSTTPGQPLKPSPIWT